MLGSLIGLLGAILLALLLRLSAASSITVQTPTIAPDVTIFLSERSISRLASEALQRSARVDFDSDGQIQVSTRLKIGWLNPVVHFGVLLEMQGPNAVSQLQWIKIGFVTIPARWLPQTMVESSAIIGQLMQDQTPPDFRLVGLNTSPSGVTFQLKWVGP
jgi:hypothetical protein